MSLTERYIAAVKKKLPKSKWELAEKELRAEIHAKIEARGGSSEQTEIEVLKELGNPVLMAEKYSEKQHFLIGPELYGTYIMILRIVVVVALTGSFIGNTFDFIFNDRTVLGYIGKTVTTALNAAIGAFGWITIVFAVLERKAKAEVLKEIQDEWNPMDLPEEKAIPKPFSPIGVTFEICFIVLFMVLINGYMELFRIYYSADDMSRFISVLNMEVFRGYLPYINGVLSLQLLLAASKLVFKKWSYPVAAGNLLINIFSLVLAFAILGNSDILNPKLIEEIQKIRELTELTSTPIESFFAFLKLVFVFAISIDSIQGFYNAYVNSKQAKLQKR